LSVAALRNLIVFTCNRPAVLLRSVESWMQEARRAGRSLQVLVCDDARDLKSGSAVEPALARLAQEYEAAVFYAGLREKLLFTQRLAGCGCADPETVKSAFFDSLATGLLTYGGNRNFGLLATGLERVLCADDDVICRPARPPGFDKIPAAEECGGDRDPSEVHSFATRAEALAALDFSAPPDVFGGHEALLGTTVGGGTVRVTLNGIAGDCGWGSPQPWLFRQGDSLQRLIRDEAGYRQACRSRELIRCVPQAGTLARVRDLMTTVCGLDATGLLPPFPSVGRGEDFVFAEVLHRMAPESRFGFLPFTLLHEPSEFRTFHEGELLRSATGTDISSILAALTDAAPVAAERSADRLREIGRFLADADAERMRSALLLRTTGLLEEGVRRLAGAPEPAPFWREDMEAFLRRLEAAMKREDFAVPLDLRYGRGLEAAAERTLTFVRRFGELMHAWPDLCGAVESLRREGVSPFRRIGGVAV